MIATCLASALVLAIGLLRMPYGYYTLLKLVVSLGSAVLAWNLWHGQQGYIRWIAAVFLMCGLLFNPIIPVHLTRPEWEPINLGALVLFGVAALVIWRKQPSVMG